MKNIKGTGKRFLALLLAVVMLLGQAPVAIALDAPAAKDAAVNEEFSVKLTREEAKAPADGTEDPTVEYQYTAEVKYGAETVKEDVAFSWEDSEGNELPGTEATLTTADPKITVEAAYQGRTLRVAYAEEDEDHTESWAPTATWKDSNVYVGGTYSVNPPVVNEPSGLEEGAAWVRTGGKADEAGVFTAALADVNQQIDVAVYELQYKGETIYTHVDKAMVSYVPVGDVVFGIDGEQVSGTTDMYIVEKQVVVSASTDASVTDPAFLAPVFGNVWKEDTSKTEEGKKFWTASVQVKESTMITVGESSLTVLVDTTEISFGSSTAFVSGDKIVAKLNYTADSTGVEKILINGKEYTEGFTDTEFETELTYEGEIRELKVKVVTKSGKEKETTVMVQAALGVDIEVLNAAADIGGTVYCKADTRLKFTVYGAAMGDYEPEVTIVGMGEDVEVPSAKNNWTVVLPVPANEAGIAAGTISMSAKDKLRPQVTETFDKKLDSDKSEPEIGMEFPEEKTYLSSPKAYAIRFSDNTGIASYEVTYQIRGKEEQKLHNALEHAPASEEVSLPLKDGDVLEKVTVNVTDATGRTAAAQWEGMVVVDTQAPVVSFSLDPEVIGQLFRVDGDGDAYAYLLEPLTDEKDEEAVAIEITVTVKDSYVDLESLPQGGNWSEWKAVEGGYSAVYTQMAEPDETTLVKIEELLVSDMGGLTPKSAATVSLPQDDTQILNTIDVPEVDGCYTVELHIDRRYPTANDVYDADVVLEPVGNVGRDAKGQPMFTGDFGFKLKVTDDQSGSGKPSGVESVVWALDDGLNGSYLKVNENDKGVQNEYVITGGLIGDVRKETNAAKLMITVTDKAGNTHTYESVCFTVDNLAPRINVSYSNNDVHSGSFFNAARIATITFTDINLTGRNIVNTESSNIVSTAFTAGQTEQTFTVTYDKNGKYTLRAQATDAAGNKQNVLTFDGGTKAGGSFTIHMEEPVITITQNITNYTAGEKRDYYHNDLTYLISVKDLYLDLSSADAAEGMAEVRYKLDGEEFTAERDSANRFVIPVRNQQVLTDIVIKAKNDAGVYAREAEGFTWNEVTKELVYSGKDVVVDYTAPEVTVEKIVDEAGEFVGYHSLDGEIFDFYNAPVKYVFSVADNFMFYEENMSAAVAIATFADGSFTRIDLRETNEIVVDAGKVLVGLTIEVRDDADNATKTIQVIDSDKRTRFNYDAASRINIMSSRKVVVDNTEPTVSAQITGIEYFYKKGEGADEEVFGVLQPENLSNENMEGTVAKVTMTITVEDMNLANSSFVGGYVEWNEIVRKDDGSHSRTGTITEEVPAHKTQLLEYRFRITDLANNIATKPVILKAGENTPAADTMVTSITLNYNAETNFYEGSILLDHRAPSANPFEVPEISLKPTKGSNYLELDSGLWLMGPGSSFELKVDDKSAEGYDSGIKSIDWSISDGGLGYVADGESCALNNDGVYSIPLNMTGSNETDQAVITIVAEDNVGNRYEFSKPFAADNKGPEITATRTNDKDVVYITTVDKVDYYNGPVHFNVKAADMFMTKGVGKTQANVSASFTSGEVGINMLENMVDGFYTGTINIEKISDILNKLVITVTDDLGNKATLDYSTTNGPEGGFGTENDELIYYYTGNPIAIDNGAPTIKVAFTPAEGAKYLQAGKANYFDNMVTVNVEVSDWSLSADAIALAYTFEGKEEPDTIKYWTKDEQMSDDTYTASFVIEDGSVLTDIDVKAKDRAGNPAENVSVVYEGFDADENVFTYDKVLESLNYVGNPMAVDMTDPTIEVVKSVNDSIEPDLTFEDREYYSNEVTYTITVKDRFLNTFEGTIEINGGKEKIAFAELAKNELLSAEDTTTATITVKDGQMLQGIELKATDMIGHTEKEVGIDKETDKLTTFVYDDGGFNKYDGNPVIVDTTKPKANVSIAGNVAGFYTRDNIAYVKLNEPGNAESDAFANLNDETVTLKIEVTDRNLTLDSNEKEFNVRTNLADDEVKWKVDKEGVNAENVFTYTKSIKVKSDDVGVFEIDLSMFDLAGNPIIADNIELTPINETTLPELSKQTQGKFATTISVDRRRPATKNEENKPPVIEVTPANSAITTAEGIELYNSKFSFSASVTDGDKSKVNSGLASVSMVIEDVLNQTEIIDSVTNKYEYKSENENGYGAKNISIEVDSDTPYETNSAKLIVTAVDNVGNTTTYVRNFAFDTKAPRVTVSYNNNSAQNGKYFKADRVATISVTDINFNAATTPITTQVGTSGWTAEGDTHTTTCAYRVDGNYTFDMSATDLAGKSAVIDYTNGGNNVAPKEFTIDKTAPIIEVGYSPNEPVNHDPQGVAYYNEELGVVVTIREVNFNAGDVKADFDGRVALGGWSGGTNHTASTSFPEGNEYSFNINYTDLAGNPAVPYTSDIFSVDLTDPTIEITDGKMTNESLNIVQGDLVLGFTIKDEQSNLSDFGVEVTHLNNEFKTVRVDGSKYFTIKNENDRTTGYIDFTNIAKEKANDGIYTVQVYAMDYANHRVDLTPELVMSLNRFGSTFYTEDEFTAAFLEPDADGTVYQNDVSDTLIIKEVNTNQVWQDSTKEEEGSTITITVNGKAIELVKGEDYTVSLEKMGNQNNPWYVYTYEINSENFLSDNETVDGKYAILFYGVDDAGNENTNESNAADESRYVQTNADGDYTGRIEFTLDHMKPVVTILGIENEMVVDATSRRVELNISDSTPCTVKVILNGMEVPLSETMEGLSDAEIWLAQDSATGNYVLNIPEADFEQTLQVVVMDAAGNTETMLVEKFLITSNWFVRMINNEWVIASFLLLLLALIIFLIVFVTKKRKSKAVQAANL